jgi:hypothetical protein
MGCRFGDTINIPERRTVTFDTAALGDLALPDPNGSLHRLGDLWATKPHVLLFLRHFG